MSKWQPEEEHLLRVLVPTNSHIEMAEEFRRRYEKKLPGFTFLRTYDAVRKKCTREDITPEGVASYEDPFTERWDFIKELNEEYKLEAEHVSIGLVDCPTRKILSISDMHYPFALEEEIENAINDHSDADICVLGGDIMDGYAFSTFSRARRIAAIYEYMAAFELVQMCAETFPMVVLIEGNHDRRPAKTLVRSDFEKEATQILRPDLLARIANGEKINEAGELVERVEFGNVYYSQFDSWYVRIGKTVFCHPDSFFGGSIGGTAEKMLEYFDKRLGVDGFDSVVLGHSHRIMSAIVFNKLLIEQGSLSSRMPYENRSNMRYPHSMNGYSVIYQDEEGNTDFNSSHIVYLGSEIPPKKDILA